MSCFILDILTLPQHKYMILEHCLYYHVQQKTDEKFGMPNALVMLPPSDGVKQENITVYISSVTLQQIWLVQFL